MIIENNYSITRLFIDKTITFTIREKEKGPIISKFKLVLRPIKDLYLDDEWNITYHVLTTADYKKVVGLRSNIQATPLSAISLLLTDLGQFSQFNQIARILMEQLPIIIPGFQIDFQEKELKINDLTITEDIWENVLYLLKLSYGEKVTPPLTFDSEEARKFYLAQQEAEERINRLKAKKQGDIDSLSKMMLSITYKFPSFTFDYLWDQTLAQILWLQKNAAGAVSYEVNAQAFAAGNVKKGKKLDFFIK